MSSNQEKSSKGNWVKGGELVKRIDEGLEKAKKVDSVTSRQLEETAKRYSGLRPVALFGIVGGAIGSVGGLALGSWLGASVILTGPVGLAAGAALFAFIYKQKYNHQQEVTTENFEVAYEALKVKYDDQDISPKLKQSIEEQMIELVKDYGNRIKGFEKTQNELDASQFDEAEIIE